MEARFAIYEVPYEYRENGKEEFLAQIFGDGFSPYRIWAGDDPAEAKEKFSDLEAGRNHQGGPARIHLGVGYALFPEFRNEDDEEWRTGAVDYGLKFGEPSDPWHVDYIARDLKIDPNDAVN